MNTFQSPGRFILRLMMFCILTLGTLPEPAIAATSAEAIRLYNLACEASLAGQNQAALEHFRQAVQAGFDDFRFAMADSELTGLTTSSPFQDLLTAHQSGLILLSSEKGMGLRNNEWTAWVDLESRRAPKGDRAALRLKWETQALVFEVKLEGNPALSFANEGQLPWLGGPTIMFILAIEDGTSPFESANTIPFVFGKKSKSGIGAILLDQQLGWQTVGELTPDISFQDKGRTGIISGTIPWQGLHPHHPLVDNPLGLNVAVSNPDNATDPFVLFHDPQLLLAEAKIHRFVPLAFDLNTLAEESMVGRLNRSILSGDPLDVDLVLFSSEKGTGNLKTNFLDSQGQSVLPTGEIVGTLDLVPGVNRHSLSADFRSLTMGSYTVTVELELPSQTSLTWSSNVLNLGQSWLEDFQQRIGTLRPLDQPTALFYLETIAQAIDSLPDRRHPGSVTSSLRELDTFVTAGNSSDSILPDSGVFLLARASDDGKTPLCSLYFPKGYRQSANLEPVVFWTDAPHTEKQFVNRLAQLYEAQENAAHFAPTRDGSFPVYIIPHQPDRPSGTLAEEVADLNSCLNWAREYFQVQEVALAGLNSAGGAVLQLAQDHPQGLSRLLVFAGSRLAPWPELDAQTLSEKLTPVPAGHPPISWLDFFRETGSSGQGKMLLSVLRDSGYDLELVKKVDGGLNWTQANDRLVLWAEKLDKF
jgi:hypothetical protein